MCSTLSRRISRARNPAPALTLNGSLSGPVSRKVESGRLKEDSMGRPNSIMALTLLPGMIGVIAASPPRSGQPGQE